MPQLTNAAIASECERIREYTQLGLSSDSLAIILALNVIQDFFRTATNLFGGQCVLLDASVKYRL